VCAARIPARLRQAGTDTRASRTRAGAVRATRSPDRIRGAPTPARRAGGRRAMTTVTAKRHLPHDELEGYVTGTLARARADALEAHVAACAACAEALAREARVEVALHEAVQAPTRVRARTRRSVMAVAALAAALVAAAAVLALRRAPTLRSQHALGG